MTQQLKQKRTRRIQAMAIMAVGLAGALLISSLAGQDLAPQSDRMGEPVIADFQALRENVSGIRITTPDDTYALLNSEQGWVMDRAEGYPIRPDRLSRLVSGLQEMTWGEGRTRDPEKFNRIRLGDPREEGTGALIELLDDGGNVAAALITGRKGEKVYARRPDDTQAYRVSGDLPPLYLHNAWLDLDIIDLSADAVSAVRLTDQAGESLFLKRVVGASDRSFRPAPPYQDYRLVSRIAASTPALALTRLQPIGVKRSSALTTSPYARHITQTHDGLEVDLTAYREEDGFFVTLRAIEAGEGARRGSTINEKAEGWAFQLSEYDWNEFTPRVSAIVRPPAVPAPDQR